MKLDFTNITIERCHKETEEILATEDASVLQTPLKQLKEKRNEFLYIESPTFEQVKAEAISLELDDVFETYMALLGLNVQKKHTATIRTFLKENLHGDIVNSSAMFSGVDGLWELNIPLDCIEGFHEEMTIEDALTLTCNFLHSLVESIEQQK